MGINIAKFYKREQWQLDCEIITPMFLGNSDQEAELRAAPFKGLLRYWWRVAQGHEFAAGDYKGLLRRENEIFGSADDNGGKSQVTIMTSGAPQCYGPNQFPPGQSIPHPEVRPKGKPINIDRFLYLGYGPITGRGQLKKEGKTGFRATEKFSLIITVQQNVYESLKPVLQCISRFGAVGSRSRNGWGCFVCNNSELSRPSFPKLFTDLGRTWQDCFDRDYPHALGMDGKQPLLWMCRHHHQDWQGVINELAGIYLKIRTTHKFHGGGTHRNPQERHALGYPCGRNHKVKGWDRHGSALRLLVRREENGYRGYFLHLPHLFSKKMWPNGKDSQIKIWQQVHQNLDKLCNRVSLQGVEE